MKSGRGNRSNRCIYSRRFRCSMPFKRRLWFLVPRLQTLAPFTSPSPPPLTHTFTRGKFRYVSAGFRDPSIFRIYIISITFGLAGWLAGWGHYGCRIVHVVRSPHSVRFGWIMTAWPKCFRIRKWLSQIAPFSTSRRSALNKLKQLKALC